MNACDIIQKSIGWCEGTPEPAGLRRRAYFTVKSSIAKFPELQQDQRGRVLSAFLTGSAELYEDKKFLYVDFLPEKSTFTSESQGEYPSITQLDKLTLVCPGVGPDETAAMAYFNNTESVIVFQDMKGRWRWIGAKNMPIKCTCAQDLGQGVAGSTSTTISIEASNLISAPFYTGKLITEDGEIDCSEDFPELKSSDDLKS